MYENPAMTVLQQHPLRTALHNEIHARPPELMHAPLAISHLVMATDAAGKVASRAHLAQLMADHHLTPPADDTIHLRADIGSWRLRWEQHTEFVSWTLIRALMPEDLPRLAAGDPPTAAQAVPAQWLAALPGSNVVSLHVWACDQQAVDVPLVVRRLLHEDTLIGSTVISGCSQLYTDLMIHADGYSRMLVFTGAQAPGLVTPRRLGRLMQRLLEIETYRMGALLGLPVAREATARLANGEIELASLADAIRQARPQDEPVLLDRLTRLAADVEGRHAETHARFSASSAYFALVQRRVSDIAETRLPGMQSLHDFLDRRLTPAMSTCAWAARRQQALSERISRMSDLLRTRVEIEQQQSSQALLAAMNARQDVQLKLQSTVEGLSVAAITYYIVGLVGYLAKGAQKIGWPVSAELTMALAIPVVGAVVWWSLRQMHRRMFNH
jgi:uncharacterized membrane-anchored protein